MKNYTIAKNQIEIGSNVKVTFGGVYLSQGFSSKGPWGRLSLRFTDSHNWLEDALWQPFNSDSIQMYEETREMATKVSELFYVFGENFKEIKPSKVWNNVYTEIVRINIHKGSEVYIKTLPVPGEEWVNGQKIDVIKTELAGENFISIQPDLEYTPLEINRLESFDLIDSEPFEIPDNIGNVKGLLDIPFG